MQGNNSGNIPKGTTLFKALSFDSMLKHYKTDMENTNFLINQPHKEMLLTRDVVINLFNLGMYIYALVTARSHLVYINIHPVS